MVHHHSDTAVVTPAASREELMQQWAHPLPSSWQSSNTGSHLPSTTAAIALQHLRSGVALTLADTKLYQQQAVQELTTSTSKAQATSATASRPRWVRCVRMIQDMGDPEYFETTSTPDETRNHSSRQQRHTTTPDLSERTPLVTVPLPSSCGNNNAAPNNSNSNNANDDIEMDDTQHRDKRLKQQPQYSSESLSDPTSLASLSWMDRAAAAAGSQDTSTVVALFYYDQYSGDGDGDIVKSAATTKRPPTLALNQLVELYGIIEETAQPPVEHGTLNGTNSTDGDAMETEDNHGWGMDDGNTEGQAVLWNAPRLHVVSFQVVSQVDDLWSIQQKYKQQQQPQGTSYAVPSSSSSPPLASTATCLAHSLGLDPPAALAVAALLQSRAERTCNNVKDSSVIRTASASDPTATLLLGCASLQLTTNDTTTAGTLLATLERGLRDVVPVVQTVSVVAKSNNKNKDPLHPRRVRGRLHQTPLQLPAGSVLLIDASTVGTNNDDQAMLVERVQTLQELCSAHRVHYEFDGGMRLPFDADYRIIVVSTLATRNTLYGTLECHVHTIAALDGTTTRASAATLTALRSAVTTTSPTSVSLQAVLELAQKTFLQRRPSATPDDFHRWLTLCRWMARSRASDTATVEDWTSALDVDERLQAACAPRG